MRVADQDEETVLDRPEIVAVHPFDRGFWGGFGASVDLGVSITKANSTRTGNLGAKLSYAAERWESGMNADLAANFAKNQEAARRTTVTIDTRRFIREKWFGTVGTNFQQSDEQELALRSVLAPGVGRFLKRTNRQHMWIAGGAQWANENFENPEIGRVNSTEAWAGFEYNLFDVGDLDFLFRVVAAPSLTDSGRLRLDGISELKWDLPKDLYFNVRINNTFDSRPPNDASRNDFTFTSGFGWEL